MSDEEQSKQFAAEISQEENEDLAAAFLQKEINERGDLVQYEEGNASVLAAAHRSITRRKVCEEIMVIMKDYREQVAFMGHADTPGGLEHMGDVWIKLARWDRMLRGEV
jgi:hypothetical protein